MYFGEALPQVPHYLVSLRTRNSLIKTFKAMIDWTAAKSCRELTRSALSCDKCCKLAFSLSGLSCSHSGKMTRIFTGVMAEIKAKLASLFISSSIQKIFSV